MNRSFARVLASAVVAAAALATGTAAASASVAAPTVPPPGTCPAVVVSSAEVVRTTHGPGIRVSGDMPHADTVLLLEAEQVDFVVAPDYWNYTVVGCGGTGPVVHNPFTTTFPAPTFPIGKCGIAVNGIQLNLGDGVCDSIA